LFAFIFFCLAVYHFVQSKKRHPLLEIHVEEPPSASFFNATAVANKERVNKFIEEFNRYINGYNVNTHAANMAAGWGYTASTIVSIISLFIELKGLP